jgi:cytoskeleton protein RodZ
VEGGLTAGGMLKEARQASGVHIAALAVALKVPINKLEALEADNYSVLPDTVFVRALASSVCRTLKVDAAPILALLPPSHSPRLAADSAGLNAPVRGRVGKSSSPYSPSSSFGGSTSRWVTIVVLALLAGALALVLFPRQSENAMDIAPPVGSEQRSEAGGNVALDAGQAAQLPADQTLGSAQSATIVPDLAAPSLAEAASAPGTSASAPASVVAPSGVLLLRARGESWVQVKDSAGGVVLQRNLTASESVSVAGPLPLSVVIGRADATEVFVRGRPFELASVSRENVARFEVK